jgi:hypothetical protein
MLLPISDGLLRTSPFDAECAELADRHYSRRTVGARHFAHNGKKLVLRDAHGLVLFVWMFPDADKRMDGQVGYNNALFRNESPRRASDIILEAEQHAVEKWGENRAYTYIDPREVKPTMVRSHPVWGFCFYQAGWSFVRLSKDGKHLLAKQLVGPRAAGAQP